MANLIFPVETLNREIDFRLALAAILSGENHNIFIGEHNFLTKLLPKFKNGVYVGKNIFTRRSDKDTGKRYFDLKNKGIDVVYLHEEGGVYLGNEKDWTDKLDALYDINRFDENDVVCCWGEFQMKYDQGRLVNKNVKVVNTGHPRFDIYKNEFRSFFENDVAEIKKKYGDFVLVNGNYAIANHALGHQRIFSDRGNYIVDDPVKRIHRVGLYAYKSIQLTKMVELVHHLAIKYPHLNFVYRPHPGEGHELYKTIFNSIPNIHVAYEGPVAPWIIGSKAIIHDGCTTAIEAQISGIPVINYKPNHSDSYDFYIANQMGKHAGTIEGVIALMDSALADAKKYNEDFEYPEGAKQLLKNLTSSSFEPMAEIIREKMKTAKEGTSPDSLSIKKAYLEMEGKFTLLNLLGRGSSVAAAKQKFYGFDEPYVKDKIAALEKILGKKINVKFHNKWLIQVS